MTPANTATIAYHQNPEAPAGSLSVYGSICVRKRQKVMGPVGQLVFLSSQDSNCVIHESAHLTKWGGK